MLKYIITIPLFLLHSHWVFAEQQIKTWEIAQTSPKQQYETILSCSKAPFAGEFQTCWLNIQHQGNSIEGADIRISGGMPQHNHGLPTAPEIHWSEESKRYNIQGLRFSMLGQWVLNFTIKPKVLKSDQSTIRFEIN